MATDSESLEPLERAADYNVEIELTNESGEAETIVCRKLGFGAMAEAAAFVKTERRMEYIRDTAGMDRRDPTILAQNAEVLRAITCTNVTPFDIVNDPAGQIKLCQLAINNATGAKATLTYGQAKDRLAHVDFPEFFRKLCILSGIYALPDKEVGEKPSDPSDTPAGSTVSDSVQPSP